jgi:hypothetical protein
MIPFGIQLKDHKIHPEILFCRQLNRKEALKAVKSFLKNSQNILRVFPFRPTRCFTTFFPAHSTIQIKRVTMSTSEVAKVVENDEQPTFDEYCDEYIASSRYNDTDNIKAFLKEMPNVFLAKDGNGNTGLCYFSHFFFFFLFMNLSFPFCGVPQTLSLPFL